MLTPDGGRWLAARGPSRGGPLRTVDPSNAHTWESAEAVQEWLDEVPDQVQTRTGPVKGGRAWMDGIEFRAIPCHVVILAERAVALKGAAEASALEGVR
jgi:hypothetical protein